MCYTDVVGEDVRKGGKSLTMEMLPMKNNYHTHFVFGHLSEHMVQFKSDFYLHIL